MLAAGPSQADNAIVRKLLDEEAGFQDNEGYFEYHQARYMYVLETCRAMNADPNAVVLDIGPSYLTEILMSLYNNVHVLALDLPELRAWTTRPVMIDGKQKFVAGFVPYNLNDAQTTRAIDTETRFDLIVMAEVIEHLYTAPELVLSALMGLMKPGGLLVCQTPNAAAIHKRLKLLAGLNPYERIRVDHTNPGHYREYTRDELIGIGKRIGLETVRHEYKDYFGFNGGALRTLAQCLTKASGFLLPSLLRGQTIVYRRPA